MATGDYYITVQRILSRVTGSTLQTFSRCKTDTDRIKYILGLEYVHDAFSLNVKGGFADPCGDPILLFCGHCVVSTRIVMNLY